MILTSNRTRELHDALKRRCLYHWIGHPSLEREIEIVRARVPGVPGAAGGRGRRVRRRAARARPGEGAGRRRDDRLDAGAAGAGPGGARRRGRGRHAGLGAEVPRGRRAGARPRTARAGGRGPAAMSRGDAVARKLVTFGRILREAGLEVGPGRLQDALRGPGRGRPDVARRGLPRAALHAGLAARRPRPRSTWRSRRSGSGRRSRRRASGRPTSASSAGGAAAGRRRPTSSTTARRAGGRGRAASRAAAMASPDELLRRRDFAEMTPTELRRLRRLMAQLAALRPLRRSRRLDAGPRRRRAGRPPHAAPGDAHRRPAARALPGAGPSWCPAGWWCCATCPGRWSPTPGR